MSFSTVPKRNWRTGFLPATLLCALCVVPHRGQAVPPAVLTQHYDNARTGQNLHETVLTPANVNTSTFGKRFTLSLDANVNGQVLYVPSLKIKGTLHNVVFAYTSNNTDNSPSSVYAFDADTPGAPLWRNQLPNSARWTTAAPVIDLTNHILFALTKDTNGSGQTHLRAFDLLTGNALLGGNITIAAAVTGTGDGTNNGRISFDTRQHNCRPALLFASGTVYVAFAHNTDSFPYHGWILAYKFASGLFTQTAVFCTTPNGGEGGVWQAGKGLVADINGNIFCTVGNGTFSANNGGNDYGMCVLKLTPDLKVVDWFAPYDQRSNSDADLDFGNVGALGLRGTNRLFAGGTKSGDAFLMDATKLGGFTPGGPDKVVNRLSHDTSQDNVGQNPASFDAYTFKYIYLWPEGSGIQQFQYDTRVSRLNPAGVFRLSGGTGAGGSLAVSSNNYTNGILWAVGTDGIVHAYDATDVSKPELWNSSQNAARDGLPSVGKWQFPVIVNGKVYVPTGSASIAVYSLLSN